MKLINEYNLEVKKSKFICFYYNISDEDEVDKILNNLKKEHKKAKHIVYTYKIGNNIKKYDDKEPKNTAGLPIYNVIQKNNLDNTLIIIVRYFGGILLGRSNLYKTYSKCASEVIKKS